MKSPISIHYSDQNRQFICVSRRRHLKWKRSYSLSDRWMQKQLPLAAGLCIQEELGLVQ